MCGASFQSCCRALRLASPAARSLPPVSSNGVGAACLELQDAHELDVNVLLFCLWCGASGRGALTADEMKIATDAVHAWHHDIVRALRAVRTLMKSGMKPAPADLAEIELRDQLVEAFPRLDIVGRADLRQQRADRHRLIALRAQFAHGKRAEPFRQALSVRADQQRRVRHVRRLAAEPRR